MLDDGAVLRRQREGGGEQRGPALCQLAPDGLPALLLLGGEARGKGGVLERGVERREACGEASRVHQRVTARVPIAPEHHQLVRVEGLVGVAVLAPEQGQEVLGGALVELRA